MVLIRMVLIKWSYGCRRRTQQKEKDLQQPVKMVVNDMPAHPTDPVELRRINFQTQGEYGWGVLVCWVQGGQLSWGLLLWPQAPTVHSTLSGWMWEGQQCQSVSACLSQLRPVRGVYPFPLPRSTKIFMKAIMPRNPVSGLLKTGRQAKGCMSTKCCVCGR